MAAQSKNPARKGAKADQTDTAVTPETKVSAAPATTQAAEAAKVRSEPGGKLGAVIALLRRPEGAQLADLMAATGWQAHSVRGVMSGAIKKKLGLTVSSDKTEAGRVYRIVGTGADA